MNVPGTAAAPKVSVAMFTYNHEPFIAQAIESVLAQKTTFPIELVIGEDYSTDGTRAIVKRFAEARPDVIRVFLREQNVGAKENAREVLAACRGEYTALLEGDDYWTSPNKLEKQVQLLEANPDCCMCAAKSEIWQRMNGADAYIRTLEGLPQDRIMFLDFHKKIYLHTSTYVFRRSSLCEALKWADKITMTDTALCYIMTDMSPCLFLPEVVSVYRITGSGIWSRLNDSDKSAVHIELFESFYKHFKSKYRSTFARPLWTFYCKQLIDGGKNKQMILPLKRMATLTASHPQLIFSGPMSVARKMARKMMKSGRGLPCERPPGCDA